MLTPGSRGHQCQWCHTTRPVSGARPDPGLDCASLADNLTCWETWEESWQDKGWIKYEATFVFSKWRLKLYVYTSTSSNRRALDPKPNSRGLRHGAVTKMQTTKLNNKNSGTQGRTSNIKWVLHYWISGCDNAVWSNPGRSSDEYQGPVITIKQSSPHRAPEHLSSAVLLLPV